MLLDIEHKLISALVSRTKLTTVCWNLTSDAAMPIKDGHIPRLPLLCLEFRLIDMADVWRPQELSGTSGRSRRPRGSRQSVTLRNGCGSIKSCRVRERCWICERSFVFVVLTRLLTVPHSFFTASPEKQLLWLSVRAPKLPRPSSSSLAFVPPRPRFFFPY